MDISTTYMGLKIPSPIIVGSCGITSSLENLKALEDFGAGAIVLKSLFEEQINHEINKNNKQITAYSRGDYQEAYDYYSGYEKEESINKYLSLIRDAKAKLKIPIIASINCISYSEWLSLAKRIEESGADALELNIATLPSDVNLSYEDVERLFTDIISGLKKIITIPISIKTGYYFTDMAKFMQRLSWTGVKSIVIFNRSFNLDIDIDKLTYKSANILSSSIEFPNTLRWTAILSDLLRCDLSATTGVKSGEDVVKLLLAGAKTVQVVSCLYRNGLNHIEKMNSELVAWMEKNNMTSLDDFRGKMSLKSADHPASILRIQFMKYFSEII